MRTKTLEGGNAVFYQKLSSLVLPIAFQQFMLAANSIANIVKNLIVSFCTGLANGGGIIVGN